MNEQLTRTEKLILGITGINVISNILVDAGDTYIGKAQRGASNYDAAWKITKVNAAGTEIRTTADGVKWDFGVNPLHDIAPANWSFA